MLRRRVDGRVTDILNSHGIEWSECDRGAVCAAWGRADPKCSSQSAVPSATETERWCRQVHTDFGRRGDFDARRMFACVTTERDCMLKDALRRCRRCLSGRNCARAIRHIRAPLATPSARERCTNCVARKWVVGEQEEQQHNTRPVHAQNGGERANARKLVTPQKKKWLLNTLP